MIYFKKEGEYFINETNSGPFAMGIYTYDQSNGSYNKWCYNINLFVTIKYYEFKADKLNFNTTRYINAHIDYYEKSKQNKISQMLQTQNNDLKHIHI